LEAGQVMVGESCFLHRLRQHLGEVRDLAFSPRNDYLCTLGGQDDNALVVWSVSTGEALCGAPAATESALCCRWLNGRNDRIVTGGYYHVRVWQMDQRSPKLHPIDAKLGTLRRICTSITITEDDECAYFGTSTGDVVKVKIDRDEIRGYNEPDTVIPTLVGVSKDRLAKGIFALACVVNPATGNTNVLVGAGDGSLQYMNPKLGFVAGRSAKLMGGITSIAVHPVVDAKFCIGTDQCNRYECTGELSDAAMRQSCHFGSVNDVAFPEGCADLIVSSSAGDIRVWNIKLKQELLRIQVPNLECHCCIVTPSGSSIVSGWDDGKVRAFFPETGRMKFVIADAHSERVSALAIADNDSNNKQWRIITGGSEGRVRIWRITPSHQALLSSLKEHRGPVNCIKITPDHTQFVSASSDGSCIVWDLERYIRLMAFFEPNVFESVLYHPDSSQMLTCGSNHKITYWDASDGQAIRVIDGGDEAMTSLDIEPTGDAVVCA
jgi:WD40 repeat protein